MEKGTKLGRYEIGEKIGTGGMGEVYLATDDQLERDVALKLLLPEFCSNAERVQRFKLEARAASTLNHPNIITIHEVGEADNRIYIATEFVNGITLRQKIEEGSLTVFDALEITQQLAGALAVAHESHIIHRDIKPENVMIRRDGYAKILDFGLAKSILYQEPGNEDKTLQMVNTQPGLVMGSVRYMSPEQARGKDVDSRTDIWSLGVVLYEMLSGKNPFDGETVSDSIAALIHLDPPPLENVPEDLQEIIKKSLQKDVEKRYPNMRDFAHELRVVKNQLEHGTDEQKSFLNQNPAETTSIQRFDTSENKTLIHNTISASMTAKTKTASAQIPVSQGRNWWKYAPFGILLAAILLAAGMFFANYQEKPTPATFESLQVSRLTSDGNASLPTLSPDQNLLAYINTENNLRSLVVKDTAANKTTEIVAPTNLGFYAPTFSPDGNSIYYVTENNAIGTLYSIPTSGGTPVQLIKDVDSRISFSPDATKITFLRRNAKNGIWMIMIADSDGKNEFQLQTSAELGSNNFSDLAWSPNSDEILVSAASRIISGNWIETKFYTVSVSRKNFRQLGGKEWINASSFAWAKDGSGVYFIARSQEGEPRQIRFLSYPAGEERQISNDSSGYDTMSLANDGRSIVASNVDLISSIWSFDPQNKTLSPVVSESRLTQGSGGIVEMPNGRILFTVTEGARVDFWTMNADGSDRKTLVSNAGINVHPVITPNGKFIVFSSNRSGNFNIWRMDIDGGNPLQLVNDNEGNDFRPQIVDEGKSVIYERNGPDTSKVELAKVSIDGTNAENFPLKNETNDWLPKVSNDGKKIAFTAQSFDTANLIFTVKLNVADLKNGAINSPVKEFSQNLGYIYNWTKDGKSISYISPIGINNILNYSLETNSSQQLTNFNSGIILNFIWSNDGKKLYIVRGAKNSNLILLKDAKKS